ncbi:MAG: heavy metal-responsive transcriptional regulator [Gammaproteobacteria bacterium]
MAMYRIGEVTKMLELSADTLRYYEKINLLPKITRSTSGVREYNDKDISLLKFIRRAQKMNFSLSEINDLIQMRTDPQHARDEVRLLTAQKLKDINTSIDDLTTLRNELQLLLNLCFGSDDNCPIIESMEDSNITKED